MGPFAGDSGKDRHEFDLVFLVVLLAVVNRQFVLIVTEALPIGVPVKASFS